MDSPLLPRFRGNAQQLDETLGDMSLLPADSPAHSSVRPPPKQPLPSRGTGTGMGSIFNRPKPTRQIEDTPELQRTISGASSSSIASASSSRSTSQPGPRFSLFGPKQSQSLQASASGSSRSTREEQEAVVEDDEDVVDQGEEEEEGDRTVTIEQEEQTPASRAAREERLKDSLYELRGINDTFEIFLDALESARGHNEVCLSSSVWDELTGSAWQRE